MRTLVFLACAAFATAAHAQERTFERPYWLDRAVIESVGRASMETQADRASFSVTFREVAQESREAMFAASDRARLAAAAIRSRGGEGVQIRSSADIQAIHQEYRMRDGERVASDRADQIDNYAVSVTLSVSLSNVARAIDVRAAAMAVGPESSSDLQYSLTENAAVRLRAYRAAVEDSAARARAAASASGSTLGRLLVLQEGQGPCLGQWQYGAGARVRDNVQSAPMAVASVDEEVVVTGSRARELRLSAEDIARMRLPEDVPPLQLSAQVCAVYEVLP